MAEENEQEVTEETTEEAPDWKAEAESAKAEADKWKGIAQRNKSDLDKLKQAQAEDRPQTEFKPKAPDKASIENEKIAETYAKLSYLEAKQIPEDDHEYLFEEAEATGKDLKDLLKFKYIQEELKNRQEKRQSKVAIPSGGKRTGGSPRDTVEYWLAKGELPPLEQVKLRREVVRKKMEIGNNPSPFTDNPVV